MTASRDVLAERHARVRQTLDALRLEALVVTHLPNIFYLTHFSGSSAIVVLTAEDDAVHFVTDFRYLTEAEKLLASPEGCPGARLIAVERTYDETLADVLKQLAAPRVGFEAAHLSVSRHFWLKAALAKARHVSIVATERIIERERLRKDAGEIAALRAAGRLLSSVAAQALAELRPGRTELEVAAAIEWLIKRAGFQAVPFATIVASGPNAAMPHWRPGSRALERGDVVVLDFGGVYDGYCVDLTRAARLGPPDPETRRVHGAVLDAQTAALAAIRPGVVPGAVDAAARAALARHELSDAFGHSTGHGLGIEVHEDPRLSRQPWKFEVAAIEGDERRVARTEETIQAGMVFTVEPGAYLPGWGGVRIEDDVLVTGAGYELLTMPAGELWVA